MFSLHSECEYYGGIIMEFLLGFVLVFEIFGFYCTHVIRYPLVTVFEFYSGEMYSVG